MDDGKESGNDNDLCRVRRAQCKMSPAASRVSVKRRRQNGHLIVCRRALSWASWVNKRAGDDGGVCAQHGESRRVGRRRREVGEWSG